MAKLFTEEQREKLAKKISLFAVEMRDGILSDLGRGSIFENIIKHN